MRCSTLHVAAGQATAAEIGIACAWWGGRQRAGKAVPVNVMSGQTRLMLCLADQQLAQQQGPRSCISRWLRHASLLLEGQCL